MVLTTVCATERLCRDCRKKQCFSKRACARQAPASERKPSTQKALQAATCRAFAIFGYLPLTVLLRHGSPQESYDLRAGAMVVGTEESAADAGGDALHFRPCNSACIVSVGRYIAEPGSAADCGIARCAVEQCYGMRSRADGIGAEGRGTGTHDDAVFDTPEDCLLIVAAGLHVGEAVDSALGSGSARNAPQEGHCLCARAGTVGIKPITAYAADDVVLRSPVDGFLIVAALRHIHKFAGGFTGLREDNLDGMILRDILERIGGRPHSRRPPAPCLRYSPHSG